MKKVSFNIKKLSVRALLAIGAALGITGCIFRSPKVYGPPVEDVYGPPVEIDSPIIEPVECVYGPPPESEHAVVPDTFSELPPTATPDQ